MHIPSLSVPDTVAPCFGYRCRSLPPPRLSENLSAAIILSWRAKSSHLTKSTGTCLEIPRLRDDRMIVSEEFSDNLPRCPPPLKTAFPPLLRRLMVVWEDFDKEMRDLCKISWILFSLFINFATDILCGLKAFLNRENMKILSLLPAIALVLLSCSAENEEIIAQQVQALSSVYVTVPDTSDAVTMETLKFRSRWMEYTDTKKEQPQTRAYSDVINLVSSQYNQWIAERGCQNRY